MVEDVVTTGLSSREAMKAVDAAGGEVVGLVSLIDRRGEDVTFDVPYYSLLEITFPTNPEDQVPADLDAVPVTKPGSRK